MPTAAKNNEIKAEQRAKKHIWSFLKAPFMGSVVDESDCEPIGEREFRLLMGLVAFATLAFGFIMNGWLG
ncbi:MAG TPA: hypothetical protein DEP53_00005, partial [Bacteroidetes bacterium]|nr:MAG: hypothetical protein A2X66_00430 [Ignavibacteria bacterium GWA2_54_16]HCA78094.1 hypothetical protein [Bacteroidota bacterium]